MVAANTRPVAREAAARIKIACRPLRAMLNFAEAARPNAPPVHEGIPNVFMEQPLYKGQDPRPVMIQCNLIAFQDVRPRLTTDRKSVV